MLPFLFGFLVTAVVVAVGGVFNLAHVAAAGVMAVFVYLFLTAWNSREEGAALLMMLGGVVFILIYFLFL